MQGTGESLTIWVAMGAGVLSFLSPCVLPIFPSYLSFVTGVSFGELSGSVANAKTRRAIILNSLCFILGFSLVFMSLGASFSLLGRLLFDYQQILRKAGGVLVILFGLYIAGLLRLPFLMRNIRVELKDRPAGYLGAFIVGVTFAAGWTPCVGAVLGAILGLAASQPGIAFLLLLSYSAGFGIPFLIVGLFTSQAADLINRYGRAAIYVNRAFGLLLIILGILIFTQYLNRLANFELLNKIFLQ